MIDRSAGRQISGRERSPAVCEENEDEPAYRPRLETNARMRVGERNRHQEQIEAGKGGADRRAQTEAKQLEGERSEELRSFQRRWMSQPGDRPLVAIEVGVEYSRRRAKQEMEDEPSQKKPPIPLRSKEGAPQKDRAQDQLKRKPKVKKKRAHESDDTSRAAIVSMTQILTRWIVRQSWRNSSRRLHDLPLA